MIFSHLADGTAEARWERSSLLALTPLIGPPAGGSHVVVLAAHPDDETLGAAGLIALAAKNGGRVHVVIASDGEASHPLSPSHSPQRLAEIRQREVRSAVSSLAPAATVTFLHLPDGQLLSEIPAIERALRAKLNAPGWLLCPWRGDQHPDHEACATAAENLIRSRPDIRLLEYPIWAWHWAEPVADGVRGGSVHLPADRLRRLDLPDGVLASKRAALGCHISQTQPLSPAAGDEAVLSEPVLAHFTRPFEIFVAPHNPTAAAPGYFDDLYRTGEDPWGFDERFYEFRKRELVLASLPRARFRRAFEPGCATGALTARLVARCEKVLAADVAERAVAATRARTGGSDVSVQLLRIPGQWPSGRFDLIVISEVGYYCADLDLLRQRIEKSLTADGVVVACHWRHHAADHLQPAESVHAAIGSSMPLTAHHVEQDFLLDVWSRNGQSPAAAEGIV